MGEWAEAKIQLCGRFVVEIDGRRIEAALPGRRGRGLFAYLVLERGRPVPRAELLMAGWGQDAPCGGGQRAERGTVEAEARPGRRSSAGAGRCRTSAPPGDLRRRRGRSRRRAPGGDLHRRGTVGAGVGSCRDRVPRRHQAVPEWPGSALDRPVEATPRGGPPPRPGVLRGCRPRPRRAGTGPGRGTCQVADRARSISRDRAWHADGSARAARQRRRGVARLRAATGPAAPRTRDRAQPSLAGAPSTAVAQSTEG